MKISTYDGNGISIEFDNKTTIDQIMGSLFHWLHWLIFWPFLLTNKRETRFVQYRSIRKTTTTIHIDITTREQALDAFKTIITEIMDAAFAGKTVSIDYIAKQ